MQKIGIDHFSRFVFPSMLKEKDGALYYVLRRADMEENKYVSDLYSSSGRLTVSEDVTSYDFARGGIVFPSARAQKDKERKKSGQPLTVYQMLKEGLGEAQEFLRLDYAVDSFFPVGEDAYLFTAAYDNALEGERAAQDGDCQVFDELPFWANGEGEVNKKRSRLYLYRKGLINALTDEWTRIGGLTVSQDGRLAAYTAVRYQDKQPLFNRLYVLDLDSLESRPVCLGEGNYAPAAFAGGDQLVFCFSDMKKYGVNQNAALYLHDLGGGSFRLLDGGEEYGFYNSVGSDVKMGGSDRMHAMGDSVYFIATIHDSSHIMRCRLDGGGTSQVTRERGVIQEFVPHQDGFAALAMRGNGGMELYKITPDGEETRLTDLNGALEREYSVVTPIATSFINREGVEIFGWVIPPADLKRGEKAPAILDIHGGPKTVYGACFFHEMQYFASCGYAVLFCNPTGGDGRGNRFADIRGKYGQIDYQDILDFVDHALERFDFIDADRLGVTGGSYGGFMTNWIIGHTDRFRAAASQRGISSWLSFSNTADIGYYFGPDQIAATAWTHPEKLWFHSPLKYADRVKTPTLFLHSDQDYRCWMAEGIQMFYALKNFGVEARLCLFHGENHELSRSGKPKNRIRRLEEIRRWMDKYVKQGEESTWR